MKKYYFSCCAIINNSLVGETIFAESRDNAFLTFKQKWGYEPSFLEGPFYKKIEKNTKPIHNKEIKMGNKIIAGIYKGFKVKGIILQQPENYVFLTYSENKDSIKKVIHISEIKNQ